MDNSSIKLLMLAVVQEQDQDTATQALAKLGLPVVFLSSAGGFLGRRNATLLIGLREGKEESALKALEESCRQRIEYLTLPLEVRLCPCRHLSLLQWVVRPFLPYLLNVLKKSNEECAS